MLRLSVSGVPGLLTASYSAPRMPSYLRATRSLSMGL